MITFGEILRAYRQASNDPHRFNRRLTQERLGELIGEEMGDLGVSGAAISYWESGESKINAQDRSVLLALIKVLHRCGGLKTLVEANYLLRAGNYSELDREESENIFGEITDESNVEQPISKQNSSKWFFSSLVETIFAISESELREAFAKAEEGPFPSWPRKLAVLLRKGSERWSLSVSSVFWMVIWACAWWLIPPSLRWPFADRSVALQAIGMYVVGTLIIPLLIGLLINTKNNEYWKQQKLTNSILLRLYTYQGAAIGFNLGYFFIFPFILVRYYLGLGSSIWLEILAVTLGLILGNMGARVIPHNFWLAYHRLSFKDGVIFFVVAFVGPLWGIFFLEYYSLLLTPVWGSAIFLAALLLFLKSTIQQAKKADMKQAQP